MVIPTATITSGVNGVVIFLIWTSRWTQRKTKGWPKKPALRSLITFWNFAACVGTVNLSGVPHLRLPQAILERKGGRKMAKYECTICGYVYDPEAGDPDSGIAPGTPFEELPDDWVCPVCGASKSDFEKVED